MSTLAALPPDVPKTQACRALNVPRHWCYPDRRRRRRTAVPAGTGRGLSEAEEQRILDALHSERFQDAAPRQVYATLLSEGTVLGSISTMYRLLRRREETRERRNQRPAQHHVKPQLEATGPDQVWTWDIERHEALSDRATVRDHRGSAVAAAGFKLRAARPGERQQGWQAALTKPGHSSTVRCYGSGEQTRKV
ncbi:MAG: hypothetical protein HND55_03965 [Pseudomonadota bacterium]|nr:MAG: hypothetical protein HND55_03965 [Pseudomonadota bacterium]